MPEILAVGVFWAIGSCMFVLSGYMLVHRVRQTLPRNMLRMGVLPLCILVVLYGIVMFSLGTYILKMEVLQ